MGCEYIKYTMYISIVFILFNIVMSLIRAAFNFPKSNILCCGIYGFSLKPGGNIEVAMAKLKILGIYNIPRGRDSCGVFIDGEIFKGVKEKKEFDDFIEETTLPLPKKNLVVLGHNRWSTRGANTEENTHPFLINERLVGTHNGTIGNIDTLCRRYGLEPKDYAVDSQALFTLLDEQGPDILKEYKGYAALAYTYLNEPNVLYLYHGASRNFKAGLVIEERPLLYLETKDGIFYSSLSNSLFAIRDDVKQLVYHLGENVIRKIENGKFTNQLVSIEREDMNIDPPTIYSYAGKQQGMDQRMLNAGAPLYSQSSGVSIPKKDVSMYREPTILKETLPLRVVERKHTEKFIYYHRGRYWIYPHTLCEGEIDVKEKGGYLANDYLKVNGCTRCYFENGIMLKDKEAFAKVTEEKADKSSFFHRIGEMNYAGLMSRYSMYPVTNYLPEACKVGSYTKNAWWTDQERMGDTAFTPKFSGRSYLFKDGFLVDIKTSHKENTLFNDFIAGNAEINLLLSGGVIGLVGESTEDTFESFENSYESIGPLFKGTSHSIYSNENFTKDHLTKNRENGPSYEENDENESTGWFYENVYKSLEAAYEEIGDMELEALTEYVRVYKTNHEPLEPDDKEISECVIDLIMIAQKSKKSIIELCDSEEDKYILIDAYANVLAKSDSKKDVIIEAKSKKYEKDVENAYKSDEESFDTAGFGTAIIEIDEAPEDKSTRTYADELNEIFLELKKNMDIMKVSDTKDDIMENIESLVNIAGELQMEPGDTYAEDVAFIIKRDIGNLIKCLNIAATTFQDDELESRTQKIQNKLQTV